MCFRFFISGEFDFFISGEFVARTPEVERLQISKILKTTGVRRLQIVTNVCYYFVAIKIKIFLFCNHFVIDFCVYMWYILTIENNSTLKIEYRAGAKQKRESGALTLQGYAREYGTPKR